MGMQSKQTCIENILNGQLPGPSDEVWIEKFTSGSLLDQLLYYLDQSLLSQRAKLKILRNLELEEIKTISPDCPIVLVDDAWIYTHPHDQFIKKGSFIWTETELLLKEDINVYRISSQGLEPIKPWIIQKFITNQVHQHFTELKVQSSKLENGLSFSKFLNLRLLIFSGLISFNFYLQSKSIKMANSESMINTSHLPMVYGLLLAGMFIIFVHPKNIFSFEKISTLSVGFMKRFKRDHFLRKNRNRDSYNSFSSIMDLLAADKAIIPVTALFNVLISLFFLKDTWIGMVCVLGFGILYFIQHISLESLSKKQLAQSLNVQSLYLQTYRNLPSLAETARKNGFLKDLKRYWSSLSDSVAISQHAKEKSALWYQARLALLRTVMLQSVFLIVVLLLSLDYLDFVTFATIQIAVTVITGPIHDLFKRLKDYTQFSVLTANFISPNDKKEFEKIGMIEFNQVILNSNFTTDINISIKSGSIYSLIGTSGSGKSEFCKVLTSMNTFHSGKLIIDGAHINASDYWSTKSIIVDNNFDWKGGKLINYLSTGDENPDFNQIRSICSSLGVDEKISQLPRGYETDVSQINLPFSYAERTLLSLARAIYNKMNVIALDNILGQTDSNFRKRVHETLREFCREKIIIFIDNEYEVIQLTDYALVMDRGAIIDHGPPSELLLISDKLKKISRPKKYFL